jgi:NADPH:quinone reductase-like Zn-dependent oxidoreductase/acyl carrier protein
VERVRRAEEAAGPESWFYETAWRSWDGVAGGSGDGASRQWIVVAGPQDDSAARAIASDLEALGQPCLLLAAGEGLRQRLAESLAEHGDASCGIVLAPGARELATTEVPPGADFASAAAEACGACNDVLEAIERAPGQLDHSPRLFVVTRAAQALAGDGAVANGVEAARWGVGAAVSAEHPSLECTRIDVSCDFGADERASLTTLLIAGAAEPQVAVRGSDYFVARLTPNARATSGSDQPPARVRAGDRAFAARVALSSGSSAVELREVERPAPGPDEVEIEVRAAGLTFLDVLASMGLEHEGANTGLGWECAGVVCRAGSQVTQLAVGDEVFGFAPGAVATHVVAAAALVVRKPRKLGFEQAAALPLARVVARVALARIARVQPGERVLIHSAAGGLGQAAVAQALSLGAVVAASAGSERKRARLAELGVERCFDSRSVALADDVLAWTQREGVDVVFDLGAAEPLARASELVAAGGRVIEIARPQLPGTGAAARARGPLARNVSLHSLDPVGLLSAKPAEFASLLRELAEELERADEPVANPTCFPVAQTRRAIQYMSQGRHSGAVVARFDCAGDALVEPLATPAETILSSGAVLVGGATGVLGFEVAEGLVAEGARTVVVLGVLPATPEEEERLAALNAGDVTVRCVDADPASELELSTVLASLGLPLAGVVCAVPGASDGPALDFDERAFERTIANELAGAWNLHRATAGLALDFFWLWTRDAATPGLVGRAASLTAAACADALARARRAAGLQATSFRLAAVPDESPRHAAERALRERQQLVSLLPDVDGDFAIVPVAPDAWEPVQLAESPLLAELEAGDAGHDAAHPLADLLALPTDERSECISERVTAALALVLRLAPSAGEQIDRHVALNQLGLDSLMAVEFQVRLETQLGIEVPLAALFDGSSLSAVVELLCESVNSAKGGSA